MPIPITFNITHKDPQSHARCGVVETAHGSFETPIFIPVGTKASVKAISPEQVRDTGAEAVLANTYHLYFQPGEEVVEKCGGLHSFMNWDYPIVTDSGGFQVFSLGAAYGTSVTKIASVKQEGDRKEVKKGSPTSIDEDGVTFRSLKDGSQHRFTPERSMEIQHKLGADIFFAFDECTSPQEGYEYQKEAMARTHRWAERCLAYHASKPNAERQALFGVVQGGRFRDLREESARVIGAMEFDGFGIGGSFDKEDMDTAIRWVTSILPDEKPRHLLGIGEPGDMFNAVERGTDMFDCVAPTRSARNGTIYTKNGKMNIFNARFKDDTASLEGGCTCYTCTHYSRAYVSHLFRAREMLASTLATIHNIQFTVRCVTDMRSAIAEGRFLEHKHDFMTRFYGKEI